MYRIVMVVAALAVTLIGAAAARADTGSRHGTVEAGRALDPNAAIAYSQAAIGRTLPDFAFLDTARAPVRLESFRGKPLIVNMAFTACSESCPLVVQSLYEAVDVAQETVGPDAFSVVTIGFDARDDTPERMRSFARGQGVDLPHWTFLSGTQSEIDRLTETLGFIYFPSPRGFDHLAQTSIIDAQGKVYRQVYGADFKAPALVDPLLELVYGRPAASGQIETLVNRVRLFCTYFDPATQRYRFDYSIFIAFAVGLGSLAGVGFILVRALLRTRRRDRAGLATLKPEV
jgi:protein SCO1/2